MIMRRLLLLSAVCLSGCAEENPTATSGTTSTTSTNVSAPTDDATNDATDGEVSRGTDPSTVVNRSTAEPATEEPVSFAPLELTATTPHASLDGTAGGQNNTAEQQLADAMEKLKPLQVVLGQWRGTTRKEFEGFKAVDQHEWVWDLQSDPAQPALALQSDKSPYLRSARLTWDAARNQFALQATDREGVERHFVGDFTEPVREIVGPDDKLHRVFRLQLTQTPESTAQTGGEAWQLALAQQENNRYLLQVDKRRGAAAFRRYDTVSTQREGTSFALDDSDYRDKTCIISQGLGTIMVSFKGRTYWVCCTGCKAAFEDDPETWIARAEKRAAEK